jgi:ribosome-associated protein
VIVVTSSVAVPEHELAFQASRASGPGGQNVNKVSTRVTLLFDVPASRALSAEEKQLVLTRLATRISRSGVLRVTSQRFRSQAANREAAIERFAELLRIALAQAPARRPTTASASAGERRLAEKKRQARRKLERGRAEDWE